MESIAILTGGGPAPGMNTVVGSVAKTFLQKGFRVIGLHGGYSGHPSAGISALYGVQYAVMER